jgi:hypothetical protein
MVFSGTVASDFLKYIPASVDNNEKLIDYSSSDWSTIRNSLISYIKAVYPLDYNSFTESDFGVFLIELMSTIGHIQSIKSDYLANENFLRTARNRSSVKKLLGLVGVRMKGPIAAAANARISIAVPAGVLNVSSVTIPTSNRVITITSPEDNSTVTYTLYKSNSDGSIDLQESQTDLQFSVTHTTGNSIVLTNAILLEGALVVESGVFASPESVKTITLSQNPYIEKSAQVFVEGNIDTAGVYTEEENVYFASGSDDKIFEVETNDSYAAVIIFGDQAFGTSPVVGDSYTVTYRVGGGERGNLAREVINAPVSVVLDNGVNTTTDAVLENSSEATGGAEAETIAHAKRYAPYTFRRQDRLVTLSDYKAFVNSFISSYGSTGKANAIVRRAYSSANIIDIFTLEKASNTQLRKSTPEYKRQLLLAMEEKKMLTDEPVIVDGLIRTLDLFVSLKCDKKYFKREEDIKLKARNKILEFFNVDNTDFGVTFIPQDLTKHLTSIDEIRYSTVDNIDKAIKVDFNEIIQLNNLTISISFL